MLSVFITRMPTNILANVFAATKVMVWNAQKLVGIICHFLQTLHWTNNCVGQNKRGVNHICQKIKIMIYLDSLEQKLLLMP